MASQNSWFNRYVNSLPERGWFKFLSRYVVVPYWIWRDPETKAARRSQGRRRSPVKMSSG